MSEFERIENSSPTIPDTLPLLSAMVGINEDEGFAWIDPINVRAKIVVDAFSEHAIHQDGDKYIFTMRCFNHIADVMEDNELRMIVSEWELN